MTPAVSGADMAGAIASGPAPLSGSGALAAPFRDANRNPQP